MESRPISKSRIPQAGLAEMNSAKTNSRSGLKAPGFATSGIKPSGIAKGATASNLHQPSASTSRIPNGPPRTHARTNSFSSSVSTRTTQSRTTSASSFSQTVGSGSRAAASRPQTSMTQRRPGASSIARPYTSLDTHEEESPSSVLGKRKAWEHDTRLQELENFADTFFSKISQVGQNSDVMKDAINLYKSRVEELEKNRDELLTNNCTLRIEMESMKIKLSTAEEALKIAETEREIAADEHEQRLRIEIDTVREEGQKQLQHLISQHQNEIEDLRRRHDRDLDSERSTYQREISQVTSQNALDTQKVHLEVANKDRQIEALERDLRAAHDDIEAEKSKNRELRGHLDTSGSNTLTLESSIRALKARIEFLESGSQEQSQAFERLQKQLEDALAETNEAKEKLRKEETLRRKLHNQVQELKGNIRVFCRVRPPLNFEPESDIAQIEFPDDAEDCKEIAVMGPEERSSLGTISRKQNAFSFDRVFGPSNQNADVFEEISQLVQSALDGYNVCIFCYGQTGSGKTHTMSSADGMIPRAVHQIYDTAKSLEEKGWTYTMEGNFVEVYNENLNDLLGKADDLDKKKHEIRHDMQRCKTTITDVNTVTLDSPEMVESILKRAAANRSVAATKANERSSRSHSVFILRLIGHNKVTGERCEGTLNLVDLAGSERLSHSGATGDRLKETQNINRSLSCLGDVIGALGSGKEGGHIPYRNSKLTYLLQFSLGGNSKTLMFVMVSPLQAHLGETLTSLKFATKVHNTHIGTAKRVSKIQN
uniref:Kinesin-like protein n=1 Tax=Talaromyces marneffei PM1 TaxID=1077442 RepID=A0A093XZ87_TALMA